MNAWVSNENLLQVITVKVSEVADNPTYVELIEFTVLENVETLGIRLVKDGQPLDVVNIEVRFIALFTA